MGMPSGLVLVDIQLPTLEPQDWHQSACVRQNGVPGISIDGPSVVGSRWHNPAGLALEVLMTH